MAPAVPGFEIKERKLERAIEGLDERRNELMTQLGEALYERARNTSMRAGNERLFDGIEKIDSQRSALQLQLEELRRENEPQPVVDNEVCPRCGLPVAADDAFCINCGFKLEKAKEDATTTQRLSIGSRPDEAPESSVRQCPTCGNPVPDDDIFCMKCGTKLGVAQPLPQPTPEIKPKPQEQKSGERRCPCCGTPVEKYSVFCIECGTKLEPLPMPDPEPQPEPQPILTAEPEPEMVAASEAKPYPKPEPEPEPEPTPMPAHARASMWSTFGTSRTVIDTGAAQTHSDQTAPDSKSPSEKEPVARRSVPVSFTQRCPRCGAPVASTDHYCAICAAVLPR